MSYYKGQHPSLEGPNPDQERQKVIVRTSAVGIAGNLALSAAKIVIGLASNSIAILLDAVNNLRDALSSVITIIRMQLASKGPDRAHPYGYGRIEYLSTIIIGLAILIAGAVSAREAVLRIIEPEPTAYDAASLAVIGVMVVGKIALAWYFKRKGTETASDALLASATEARMDSLISASTLATALIYLATGMAFEAWLAALISLAIVKAGFDVLREAISKVLGQRVSGELSRAIKETVRPVDGVRGAYDLVLNDYGPQRLWGSVHVEIDGATTADRIDALSREIEKAVYCKHRVILHTVGIYSSNAQDEADPAIDRIRADIERIVRAYDEVIEMHGLFVSRATKTISFDIIVSCESSDCEGVYRAVVREASKRYPEYGFEVALDPDVSD